MKTKRFFAASVLAMTLAAIPTIAAQARDISTVEQFKQFIADVNATQGGLSEDVTLMDNIDFGNEYITPAGTLDNPYKGTFNGNGKTISGAKITNSGAIINVGVFGYVNGGTIKDVTFSNIHVDSNANVSSTDGNLVESTTGVAVGSLYDGTISNVTVDNTCSVKGVLRTGGIAGDASHTQSYITNCKNYATVTGGAHYTGGIVGATHNLPWFNTSATGTHITGCYNYGTVTGDNEVGGIAGYTDRAVIDDCHNEEIGAVSSGGNYGTGGIVGCDIYNYRSIFRPSKGSSITGCTNSGTITTIRGGGILGSFVAAPSRQQPTSGQVVSTITGCTNYGNIVTEHPDKCGGIFGYQITYANGDAKDYVDRMIVKIINCKNEGKLNGEKNSTLTLSDYVQIEETNQ